ncbi:MAG TPA: aspartate kinase, partial [Planctomycetota bacterium]|nr:aspartate kinase [Planctomycetota bacterium]
ERIRTVIELARAALPRRPVVVVSAHSGVTNLLFDLARRAVEAGESATEAVERRHFEVMDALGVERELIAPELRELRTLLAGVAMLRELSARSQDCIASFGERMAAKTVAAAMRQAGLDATALAAWDAGLTTDARFGAARPLASADAEVRRRVGAIAGIPVITGYIGRTEKGEVTTLGRGGSDYSAAIFGAALDAEEIQIWTDVDGVLTTDPKIVKGARVLDEVSFDEASELAFFGAKVIHPATMLPAVEKNIPILVLNTFNPKAKGTRILARSERSREVVKCIALRKGVRVINIASGRMLGAHGFIRRLGEVFDRHEIPLDMMATSEVSVSVTIDAKLDAARALEELRQFARVSDEAGRAIVCVVGEGLHETPGIAAKAFQALARAGVNVLMISQGASRINLGLVVEEKDAEPSVRTLHAEFFS